MIVETKTKNRFIAVAVCAILLGPAVFLGSAHAHHSFNMFDMESTITIEGVVTDFDFVNPHGWIIVETTDENGETVVWEIETISALIMRRRGIERDSLSAGDRVSVEAHPARNPAKLMANGEVVRTPDGKVLAVGFQNGDPNLEIDRGPAVAAPASGPTGIWRAESRLIDVADPRLVSEWPLTDRARAALAEYDGSQTPSVDCVPYSPPILMLTPLTFRIDVDETAVRFTLGGEDAARVVYTDGRDHPENAPPSNEGHSIGQWEDDVLVIDTVNFTARDVGHAFGIPSGSGKHLIERLSLNEAGTHIDYRYEVVDPEYLTAPVTGESTLQYRPDLGLEVLDCDVESARRFLDVF